jgi:hypothetical protein
MAQSDSQRSEFEEPDSSNLDSVVPADNGGEAPKPAKIDEPQPANFDEPSVEFFGGDVEGLLGGIDIGSDLLGLEIEDNTEIEESSPDLVESTAEIDLEIDDSAAVDIRNKVANAFAEEEEVDSVDASGEGASSLPTSEELLAQAGSILSGGDFQLPVEKAEEEVLDEVPVDVEENELMAMPDSQSLMNQAGGEEGADEELMAMPDPQTFMTAASDSPGEPPDQPRRVVGSNIADRAGDLPPPPPAPVCLDDAEIYVEEEVVESKEPEVAKEVVAEKPPPATIEEESEEQSEPESFDDVSFLMDDDNLLAESSSLDGFNIGFAEAEGEEGLAANAELAAGNESHLKSGPSRGILDIIEGKGGDTQALLNLTTVAFEDQPGGDAPEFFRPSTVTRLALKTDGYRMEGDGAEISIRLIRGM